MASSIILKRAAASVAAAATTSHVNFMKMNKLPLHPIRSLFSASSSSFQCSSIINEIVDSSHCRVSSPPITDQFSSGGGKMEGGGGKEEEKTLIRESHCVAKLDDEAVHFRVELPGFGKDNIRVSVDKNTIHVEGEVDEEEIAFDNTGTRCCGILEVNPANLFKLDQVKAAMKNGFLRVSVPRIKKEEREDIFQVKVE